MKTTQILLTAASLCAAVIVPNIASAASTSGQGACLTLRNSKNLGQFSQLKPVV